VLEYPVAVILDGRGSEGARVSGPRATLVGIMRTNGQYPLRLLFLATAIACLCGTTALFAASPEEEARRFLTMAYEGRFDALPKSENATTETFERRVRNTLRVRCVRVEGIVISDAALSDDAATLELEIALRKSERSAADAWMATEVTPLRMKLRREGERWLVSAIEFPDDEFAEQLLAAGEEWRGLLREHPDRISRSLARAVYARAIATFNYSRGSAEEVSRNVTRAASIAREIAIGAGDRGGEALALGVNAIDAWMQHHDLERGVQLSRESLAIAESVGDAGVLARAWYNLGRALGEYTESRRPGRLSSERMECYRKALTFAERSEDPGLLIRVLTILALAANHEQCDHLSAIRYAGRILTIAREQGDPGGEVDGEALLASIYDGQGDHERSEFHHQRALRVAEEHHSRLLPLLQLNSADRLIHQGRLDEARVALTRLLQRDERGVVRINSVASSRNNVGIAMSTLAELEAKSGNLDEAECLYREAGAVHSDEYPNTFTRYLSEYYLDRKDYRTALRLSMMTLADNPVTPVPRIYSLIGAARAYRGLGQRDRALTMVLEAIEIREEIKDLIAGSERQNILESDRRAAAYELAAEIVLEDGAPPEAALAYLERGRARVLTGLLEHGRPGAMAEAEQAEREEEVRQERELVRLRVDLDRASNAGDRDTAGVLSERLREARAMHATFVDGVRARSERRAASSRHADAGDLADLGKRLPPGIVAAEYFVSDDRLHVLLVRPDASGTRVIHRTTVIERHEVERKVNRFLDMLSGRDLRVADAARDVYELLIQPIESELSGVDALLVVPDEVLWRVPFAALADRHGRFLVERAAIVYAPSITAFTVMAEAGTMRSSSPGSLFAIANPTVAQAAKTDVASFYRDATLNPLPDAEREVDAVRMLYDPRHSLVLMGEEATEARTKSAVGDAAIVHFATHALLDDANPMYSRLALARDGAAIEDGWLESWEIARLDLAADIVILSACETARGQIGGGEGVVGMAWSFFVAGARSIVATQWKIASSSTAQFMIDFHQALHAGRDDATLIKARALREAQLRLLREPRFGHPFYWAAFVLIGDPSFGGTREMKTQTPPSRAAFD
jgi:CHAT domain-containing protein